MNKTYPLKNSPLYGMRNRTKLALLLGLNKNYFSKIHKYTYNCFSRPKPNGGERYFTEPTGELKLIQKRINRLLSRIETPNWVTSGKKQNSYVTNAQRHRNNLFVKTMDISQFYESVQRGKVYKLFRDTFKMEKDICWLMTNLVTYKGKLPTGSPTSQLIVYWAYSQMFEEISTIALDNECEFTLYVDDMTFSSMHPISNKLREEVDKILKKDDLKAKSKKDHYYQSDVFKVVTGVGIQNGELRALNGKKKQILDKYRECKASHNLYEIEKLKGMLCSLRQIESGIFPEIYNFVKHFDDDLKVLSKNRYYQRKRNRTYNLKCFADDV
ncbi:MAG: reverse transcriptase family protein [Lachnospiraceae bacterium]